MNVYVLLMEEHHYGLEIEVYADKDEATNTAACRSERDMNRWRKDSGKKPKSVDELHAMGLELTAAQANCHIVWSLNAYGGDVRFSVVEEIVKR